MKTFLGSAVLVGFLKEMAKTGINLVNAPLTAQEMGVTITVNDHPDSQPSVAAAGPEAMQVKVTRGQVTHSLLGESFVLIPFYFIHLTVACTICLMLLVVLEYHIGKAQNKYTSFEPLTNTI